MNQKPVKRKCFVFLDRDGVINVDTGDYTTTIDQWQWAPGAIEGIKMLAGAGFGIIAVTNQSCIAKDLQTEEGLAKLHNFMINHIRKAGGDILRIYHCPHQNQDGCNCRKPKPGMFLRAAQELVIDLASSYFGGDAISDIEAAFEAGCLPVYVLTGLGQEQLPVLRKRGYDGKVPVVRDLAEAVYLITGC